MPIPVSQLVTRAAELFRTTPADITSKSRSRIHLNPRAAVTLAARAGGRSFPDIGRRLGGRDHSTAINAKQRGEILYERCPSFRSKVDDLRAMAIAWNEQHGGQPLPTPEMVVMIKADAADERRRVAS